MNDSVSINKNVLIGGMVAVVVLLIAVIAILLLRPSGGQYVQLDPNAGTVQAGSTSHATGYAHSDLMPAVPGSGSPAVPAGASAPANPGHASGYSHSDLMPAPQGH